MFSTYPEDSFPESITTRRIRNEYMISMILAVKENAKFAGTSQQFIEHAKKLHLAKIKILSGMIALSFVDSPAGNKTTIIADTLHFAMEGLCEMGFPKFTWEVARDFQRCADKRIKLSKLFLMAAQHGCAASTYQLSLIDKDLGKHSDARKFAVLAGNLGHPFAAYQVAMEIDRGKLYQHVSTPKRHALMAHFLSIALSKPIYDGTKDVSAQAARKLTKLFKLMDRDGKLEQPKNPILIDQAAEKLHQYRTKKRSLHI